MQLAMSVRPAAFVCRDNDETGVDGQALSARLRAVLTMPDTQGWLPEGQPDYSKPGCQAPPKPGEKRGLDDDDRCVCAICFAPLEEWEEHGAPFLLGRTCEHQFHGKCLHSWVEGSKRSRPNQPVLCPTCRTPIDAADLADLGERFADAAINWVERVREDYRAWRDVPLSYERWPDAMREASKSFPHWAMETFREKNASSPDVEVFSKRAYGVEAMFCISRAPLALQHVDVDVLAQMPNFVVNYKNLAQMAVAKNWVAVKYFTRKFSSQLDSSNVRYYVMRVAIEKDPRAIQFAEVRSPNAPTKPHSILFSDREYAELAMIAVRASPSTLEFVDPFGSNYDVLCKEALKADPMQFGKVWSSATDYVGLAKFAVSKQGSALQYVPKSHSEYMSIAMEAMKKPGKKSEVHPIHFVPYDRKFSSSRDDRTYDEFKTLLLEAIQHDPWGNVLSYAPAPFRHDQEVVMAAVTKTWKALEFVLLDLTLYPFRVLKAAVSNHPAENVLPQVARMIGTNTMLYEEIANTAIDRDATAILHVDPRSDNYYHIALRHATQHKSLSLIPPSHRLYGLICRQALAKVDRDYVLEMLAQVDVSEPEYYDILKTAVFRGRAPGLSEDHPYFWDVRELIMAMP